MRQQARILTFVVLTSMCFGSSGCLPSNPKDIEAFLKPYEVDVNSTNYILHPPDEIEVHCAKVPEINLQRQIIRPDGKISFESLGEIKVAGKTPAQVAALLHNKAKELYNLTGQSPVDVRVAAFRSKVYYVLGEVAKPGPQVYTGRDTVLTAVASANILITAWEENMRVIRPSEKKDQKPRIFKVNLHDMMMRGDVSKNVLLHEGDIIYIPPTILAAIGNIVAELVRPIGLALSPVLTAARISSGDYM